MTDRAHHRPARPGADFFAGLEGGPDPEVLREAADAAATVLVRGARDSTDPALPRRLQQLAETEGLETLAELWAGAPADSLAGCLWRLFALRAWVYADSGGATDQFDAGRRRSQVATVVAGVPEPPHPDELRAMVDEVLRGIAERDFADVLLRASAFARIVAVGRAERGDPDPGRMLSVAEQLEHAAHLELAGELA